MTYFRLAMLTALSMALAVSACAGTQRPPAYQPLAEGPALLVFYTEN